MGEPLRVHMWCVPRAMSTVTMYAFSQRDDTAVLDEPLYAHHLVQNPHLERPYKDKLLESQKHDGNEVIKDIMGPNEKRVVFVKHMSKHICSLDLKFLEDPKSKHVFLIRDPVKQLSSWNVVGHRATLDEVGIMEQYRLIALLREMGKDPIIVDSDLLKMNPKVVLSELCQRLGLEFDERMLTWPTGPKECDGVWAYHWYKTAHTTTGFSNYANAKLFPPSYMGLLSACMPLYKHMRASVLGSDTSLQCALDSPTSSDRDMKTTPLPDERNRTILIHVGGQLEPREMASVSVFDSTVQGGDACAETFRVYKGKAFKMYEHITRLLNSAKALGFNDVPSRDYITKSISECLIANDMRDEVQCRVTLSRGKKTTSSIDPRVNVYGSTLIILPEWKALKDATTCIKVLSTHHDASKSIGDTNLIKNILPKIQANVAKYEDALLLGVDGFVSQTSTANVFCVMNGTLVTPPSCAAAVTRKVVIDLATKLGVRVEERQLTLAELVCADEVFAADALDGLTAIGDVDGRTVGEAGARGSITERLQIAYVGAALADGDVIPFR
eukprot:m.105637 g.105637  ORF g.105637 m.105637 type:complete len:556 (-) comp27664_c0_seq1:47-1714(-)